MITQQDLPQFFKDHYGIEVLKIELAPRQFVADTFILTTVQNKKNFLKVIEQTEPPKNITKSLHILDELFQKGLQSVPSVIQTLNKQLNVEKNGYIYILLSYVEGEQSMAFDHVQLADFLGKLHTSEVQSPVEYETFNSYVDRLFPLTFNKLMRYQGDDLVRKELKEILSLYEIEIREEWKKFQKIIKECQKQNDDSFVITHGDLPMNVMVSDNNKITVIDWDNIKIAPVERDTWFFKEKSDFMKQYLKIFPHYKLNSLFFSYYAYWRMFDDLFGWTSEIFSETSLEERQTFLDDLKEDYFNWFRPLLEKIELL